MGSVTFSFYSDTNQSNAKAELELLSLETLEKAGPTLTMRTWEYLEMEPSIRAIVTDNGGVVGNPFLSKG